MQIHFDRIYIIESLQPPGDTLTGTNLHTSLLRDKSSIHPYEDDLNIRFDAFYRELFSSFDLNKAYDALKRANPLLPDHYGCYSAEEVFALAFTGYEKSYCSPEALKARAYAAMAANGNMNRRERRQFERTFIKEELKKHEPYFRHCYQTFFMLDRFPELADTIGFGNSLRKMKDWFNHV